MNKSDKPNKKSEQHSITNKIIIVLIIILLLISCSSGFFGKIGSFWDLFSEVFLNNNKQIEKIYNKELNFIIDSGEIYIDDIYKVEFDYTNIIPSNITCQIDDTSMATCIVKDNYIEVYPKKVGQVLLEISTITNGKEYIATHKLTIKEIDRSIKFLTNNKNITLDGITRIPFVLNNLFGEVESHIDNNIANVSVVDNTLIIEPLKSGIATITISIHYNDVVYSDKMTLTIENNKVIYNKSNDNNISKLDLNGIDFEFDKNITTYNLTTTLNTINLNYQINDKANSYYYFNESYTNQKTFDLVLENNKLVIVVIAENGTTKKYVFNIIKQQDLIDINTLESISNVTSFKKDILKYDLVFDFESIDFHVVPTDIESKIEYYIDSEKVDNLDNIILTTVNKRIEIKVISQLGNIKVYEINVKKGNTLHSNTLESISNVLNFDKNILNYVLIYESGIKNISFDVVPTDIESKIEYYIDSEKVDNLDNIILTTVNKKIEIKVTNNNKRTYILNIKREASDINTLDSLYLFGYEFNFDKYVNNYDLLANYNQNDLNYNYNLTDANSSIKVKLNDVAFNDTLLQDGLNKLEFIVTSESGISNIYTLNIIKPVRKIVLDKSNFSFYYENGSFNIIYEIYEDIGNGYVLTENYNENDILVYINNYKGNYEIKKGYIKFNPDKDDINNNYSLKINYLNKNDQLNIYIMMKDYYVKTFKDIYNFDIKDINIESIILNTNLFDNTLSYENITNGIRYYNNKGYIDITTNSNIATILPDYGTGNYLPFKLRLNANGVFNVDIKINVYDKYIYSKSITVNVTKKYSVIINANGGFYNAFTDEYKYFYEYNMPLDLGQYVPYKTDISGNCLYYEIISYNTKSDGTGTNYSKNDIITITDDITLYAIYSNTSRYEQITETNILYLTDVDLFFNKEYYDLYNEDKVIYPSSYGTYTMNITNNTEVKKIIKAINLKENNVCNELGCINMAYILKYTKPNLNNWNYIYGTDYKVLNLDSSAVKNGSENTIKIDNLSIELEKNESVSVVILWKWVELNDLLDTQMGVHADEYELMVSIEYDSLNEYCTIN